MAAPQPKTSELGKFLNLELAKPRSDDLTLKRMERDARALMGSADARIRGEAQFILGAIEGLRFRIDEARDHLDQAVAITGGSAHVLTNYAAVLGSLGFTIEALDKAEHALEKDAGSPTLLRSAIKLAAACFDIERTEAFERRLRALGVGDDDRFVKNARHYVEWQRRLFSTPGVTREALVNRYRVAVSVAFAHHVRISEERVTSTDHGILLEWSVGCDDDEVAAMNFETVSALSDLPPDASDLQLAFGYTSAETSVRLAA